MEATLDEIGKREAELQTKLARAESERDNVSGAQEAMKEQMAKMAARIAEAGDKLGKLPVGVSRDYYLSTT